MLARSANGALAIGLVALLAACAQTSGPIGGEPLIGGPGPTPDALPTPTPAQDCLAPSTVVTAVAGDAPAPVCVRRGDHLTVKTSASVNQPWQTMTTEDETIVVCASRPLPDGGLEATCTALALGTTTISTITGPYTGDPHGPQQSIWRLTITVMPT